MRDQTITDAFLRFEKAVGHDIQNLTKQNVINRSRIYAFERVLFGGRWFLLKAILMCLVSPQWLKSRINMAQAIEVEEFNQEMTKRFGDTNGKKVHII